MAPFRKHPSFSTRPHRPASLSSVLFDTAAAEEDKGHASDPDLASSRRQTTTSSYMTSEMTPEMAMAALFEAAGEEMDETMILFEPDKDSKETDSKADRDNADDDASIADFAESLSAVGRRLQGNRGGGGGCGDSLGSGSRGGGDSSVGSGSRGDGNSSGRAHPTPQSQALSGQQLAQQLYGGRSPFMTEGMCEEHGSLAGRPFTRPSRSPAHPTPPSRSPARPSRSPARPRLRAGEGGGRGRGEGRGKGRGKEALSLSPRSRGRFEDNRHSSEDGGNSY